MKTKIFCTLYILGIILTWFFGPWPEHDPKTVGDLAAIYTIETGFSILWPLVWLGYLMLIIGRIPL